MRRDKLAVSRLRPGFLALYDLVWAVPAHSWRDRMGDYYVSVKKKGHSSEWTWRILRRSRPLGVRLYGDGFRTAYAARKAGGRELAELLNAIGMRTRDAKSPQTPRRF
jgi:hypothetical protein